MRSFYCCLTLATAFCVAPLAASAQSVTNPTQNQTAKAMQAHSYHGGHRHRHGGHRRHHGGFGYHRFWVCYNYRTNFYSYGRLHHRYHGCFKSNRPCHTRWVAGHRAKHFGKYSSPGSRNGGYFRCLRSAPRFVSGPPV